MSKPRFQLARAFKWSLRTAGDVTYATTTWGDFSTTFELVVPFAEVGDVIEVGVNGQWRNEAVAAYMTSFTMVSSSPVTDMATGAAPSNSTFGAAAWFGNASVFQPIGGSLFYTLQAGDISSGTCTIRLRGRCTSATTKTLSASTANVPFQWFARNLGPADPN